MAVTSQTQTDLLLGETGVNHEHDAINSERRFGDVGRHDDLASDGAVRSSAGRRLEDALLQVRWQRRVERNALRFAHFRSEVVDFALNAFARLLDFLLRIFQFFCIRIKTP